MSTADNVVDFEAKEGEQLVVQATLKGADGNVADLTGKIVTFNMRPLGSAAPIINGGACAIIGLATAGVVRYTGAVADTSAYSGSVEADFKSVDIATGLVVQKFPNGKNANLLGYITPKVA